MFVVYFQSFPVSFFMGMGGYTSSMLSFFSPCTYFLFRWFISLLMYSTCSSSGRVLQRVTPPPWLLLVENHYEDALVFNDKLIRLTGGLCAQIAFCFSLPKSKFDFDSNSRTSHRVSKFIAKVVLFYEVEDIGILRFGCSML